MYENVLAKLTNLKPTRDKEWQARCPAHQDDTASLAVKIADDGKLLIKCHAGCTFAAIRDALGLRNGDFFPPRSDSPRPAGGGRRMVSAYNYCDEQGEILYQVLRYVPKDFRQRRPDGKGGWDWSMAGVRRVLFGLPELLAADPSRIVFVVEGEKDVLTARKMGLLATTNAGGAGKWCEGYTETLRGRPVIVIPDNDYPGKAHAKLVSEALQGVAKAVRVLELPGLPEHGDLSNWVAMGGTKERLAELLKGANTPRLEPAPPGGPPDLREIVGRLKALVIELEKALP
jgi:putative DNA primase/helicase